MTTTVTILAEKRAQLLFQAIGSSSVPVRSPLPQQANIEGEEMLAYILDEKALADDQREAIVDAIMRKFNVSENDRSTVVAALSYPGIAIPAADVLMSTDIDLARFF